jgi:formylglycine-generating enzyme required for sulfatase activity
MIHLLPLFNNQQKMTKIFYLLLIFLMIGFHGSTQDLREMRLVGEAQKSDSEIVTRRDNNGNLTAGIMVISDMDGFGYDAFNGVIGNVDDRPGMDIVYLQTTERVLEIYKTGYRPLKIILADEGIRLRPQEVWQITVAGDELINALPVVIRFTPDDAVLYINNTRVDRANTYSLALGQHNLRIEKERFQPIERTITVNEQNIFFEYTLQRQPDAGLQIETTPARATVYLDGVSLGQSPVAAFYKPGTYPIRIVKEGYVTIENQTLEVALPQTRKSYTLEENVGWLTINTHSGASVFFNDQLIANPKNVKLPPQLVRIKVTMPKAEPLEQQVILKRNERLTLDMFPEVQTGTIQIAVTPFDAQIELTGDAGEKYSAVGMKIFEDIPVGTYTIKVTAAGYEIAQESITLRQGGRVSRSLRLSESRPAAPAATTTDFGIEMVFVKGGPFSMGCTTEQRDDCSDDEKPAHQVLVSAFFIGKYEVTQKQWIEIMGDNPSYFDGCDDCPVESVSWHDVQEFIKRLNQKTGRKYRLPTESEWEYAARGGASIDSSTATKYAGSNNIEDVAWYRDNSESYSKIEIIAGNVQRIIHKPKHVAGKKLPNRLGIYDLSGNVSEWCSDFYDRYPQSSQTNPQGPSTGTYRVIRGGSWYEGYKNCRVTNRNKKEPSSSAYNIGFRLALDFSF